MNRLSPPGWLGVLLLISAFLPIPLPRTLLPEGAQANALHLRWGLGEISIQKLKLKEPHFPELSSESATLQIHTLPGSSFLQPKHLKVIQPVFQTSEAAIQKHLQSIHTEEGGSLAPFFISIEGGSLAWTSSTLPPLHFQLQNMELQWEKDVGRLHLLGQMDAPFYGEVEIHADASSNLNKWEILAKGFHHQLPEDPPLSFQDWGDLELQTGKIQFHIHAKQPLGEAVKSSIRLQLQDGALFFHEPSLLIQNVGFLAQGSLQTGIGFQVDGSVEDTPWDAHGTIHQQTPNGLSVHLRGETGNILIDADRVDWLRQVLPEVALYFESLELRGSPTTRFAIDWTPKSKTRWAIHAQPKDFSLKYKGFLNEEGHRASFPYPVTGLQGDFIASHHHLLADVHGQAGDGSVDAQLVLGLWESRTALQLDVHADGIPVDAAVTSAVAGTPEIHEAWRSLGRPKNGHFNADITLRGQDFANDGTLRIEVDASHVQVQPSFLPVSITANTLLLSYSPTRIDFQGIGRALQGEVAFNGQWDGGLALSLDLENIQPSLQERRVLQQHLGLPAALENIEWSHQKPWNISLRSEPDALSLTANLPFQEDGCQDTRTPDFPLEKIWGNLMVQNADGKTLAYCETMSATLQGNPLQASIQISPSFPNNAVLSSAQFQLSTSDAKKLLRHLRLDKSTQHLHCQALLDGVVAWNPNAANTLEIQTRFHPLTLQASGLDSPLEIFGEISFTPSNIKSNILQIQQGDSAVQVKKFHFQSTESDIHAEAVLHSNSGVQLTPQFFRLLGPQAETALHKVGLQGTLFPQEMKFIFEMPTESVAQLSGSGGIARIEDFRMSGPPEIEQASAEIELETLQWDAKVGTHANLLLHDGRGKLFGLPFSSATGTLKLNPEALHWTNFQMNLLGGVVQASPSASTGGNPFEGIRLGLSATAPMEANLHFQNLQLKRLQEDLQLGTPLQGNLSGEIHIKSPTPNPLDYQGTGKAKIRNGRLSAVPILSQLWATLGIRPPIFRKGNLEYTLSKNGQIHVQKFSLEHDLLEVQGKGLLRMDQSVEIQVTIRKMMFILGLPLEVIPGLDYIFDLFVKKEYSGPLARLTQSQRSLRKLFKQDLPAKPFPLWVPPGKIHSWNRSPAFP